MLWFGDDETLEKFYKIADIKSTEPLGKIRSKDKKGSQRRKMLGKMLRQKKAWIRILEAFIAILLMAGVLIVLYARTIEKPRKSEEIYKLQRTILEEIASDPELRNASLNLDEDMLSNFVADRIPPGFNFTIRICKVGKICELGEYKGKEGKEVYSTEGIISSTLEIYEPKKLKIFMWLE